MRLTKLLAAVSSLAGGLSVATAVAQASQIVTVRATDCKFDEPPTIPAGATASTDGDA